ncbi:MAG: hypothetical protein JXA52_09760 [Planctomycetes bacterium]|nr:hypothetical protein [Planctomycetota bacterium]
MKTSNQQAYLFTALICAVLVAVVFYLLDYAGSQGFNPSDDGVVLAQAFRILHGEIPHRDFIAIRPACSGFLHTLNFLGIFPLVMSGRIFMISELFLTAFIWTWLLDKSFNLTRKRLLYPCLGIIALVMSLNSIIIFPWTTVDALFFSILSFALSQAASKTEASGFRLVMLLAAGLACSCLAAISRQIFAVIVLTNLVLAVYFLLQAKRPRLLPAVILLGFIPAFAYLVMLLFTGSWDLFIQQMTGRTELFETGVTAFAHSLYVTGYIHAIAVILAVYIWLKTPRSPHAKDGISRQPERVSWFWQTTIWCYAACTLTLIGLMFILGNRSKLCFELFWCLTVLEVIAVLILRCNFQQVLLIAFALLLGWTTSISLGSNYPSLCAGILATTILTITCHCILEWNPSLRNGFRGVTFNVVGVGLSLAVAASGIWMQLERNFRDLPANKLKYELGELLPGFAGIKTNARTFEYYREIVELFRKYPNMQDNLVIVPNNAMLYPVLGTRNPFPLDWLQQEEFVGSEAEVVKRIQKVLQNRKIYILVEKYNSKRFSEALFPLNQDPVKYPYLELLFKNCTTFTPQKLEYFTCLVSSPVGDAGE